MKIPDEAVKRALSVYRGGHEGGDLGAMRAALEAAGAVFLTDEERLDVLSAIARQHEYFDEIGVKHTFLSVLEKLS